jgi:hypothetical protein
MRKDEIATLTARLEQLAEFYRVKAPTSNSVLIWADALDDLRFDELLTALSDWPRTGERMPTVAELRRLCALRRAERMEKQSEADNRNGLTVGDLRPKGDPNSAAYRAHLAAKARIDALPRPNRNDWWHDILAEARLRASGQGGRDVLPIQLDMALRAWNAAGRPAEHAPPGVLMEAHGDRDHLASSPPEPPLAVPERAAPCEPAGMEAVNERRQESDFDALVESWRQSRVPV